MDALRIKLRQPKHTLRIIKIRHKYSRVRVTLRENKQQLFVRMLLSKLWLYLREQSICEDLRLIRHLLHINWRTNGVHVRLFECHIEQLHVVLYAAPRIPFAVTAETAPIRFDVEITGRKDLRLSILFFRFFKALVDTPRSVVIFNGLALIVTVSI